VPQFTPMAVAEDTPPVSAMEAAEETDQVIAEEGTERQEESGAELYHGQVDLIIAPPIDVNIMRTLEASLHSCPGLQVLAVRGSAGSPPRISIQLEKPLRLAEMLRCMPMVKAVVEERQGPSSPAARLLAMRPDEKLTIQQQYKILIVLKGD